MDLRIVYDFYRLLEKDSLSFLYQGSFSDEITDRILDLSEYNLNNKAELYRLSNKVSFLMAECFQNIVRHGDHPDIPIGSLRKTGLFITRNIGTAFFISSANLIFNEDIEQLQSKLDTINQLDKDELRELYLEVLGNKKINAKGGAGLGLIEMARRSGQKLDYKFVKVNDKYSFFYLQIKLLDRTNDVSNAPVDVSLDMAGELHTRMSNENILIIHKGDFAQDSVLPILKMIENTIQDQIEPQRMHKKTYHLLVEILQNVSKHSYDEYGVREGIFLMSHEQDRFVINTGNYIKSSQVKSLRQHLESLNNMTSEELMLMYKQTLKNGVSTPRGGAGLGLIDIARESAEKLEFHFFPVDDNKSFYSLRAKF
jgi:hypothetical protein